MASLHQEQFRFPAGLTQASFLSVTLFYLLTYSLLICIFIIIMITIIFITDSSTIIIIIINGLQSQEEGFKRERERDSYTTP